MMVAVLLGALSLGACVDDNESASVTNVREAKAKQLTAMAALDNAKAEAELIAANAEKALKEAQAEYQKALAAASQQQTEEAKAKFAIEIEKIKAKAEAAIAAAKLQAAQDEQALLDLADERVRELYGEYKSALSGVIYLQNRKIELTTNISQTEANLVPVKTQADNQVAYYQKLIDLENYKINLYKEYKGADLKDLKQKAEKARMEAQAADDTKVKKEAAKNEADNAFYAENPRFNMWSEVTNPIKTIAAAKELRDFDWSIINEVYKELSASKNISYYTLNASSVERTKQNLTANVKNQSDYIGTDKDDATKSTLYGQLANVKKQKADALEADPEADVTYYDNRIAQLNADITTQKSSLATAQENLTKFNSLIASFAGDDLKAYDAAVVALTKLAEAYEKANTEYLDATTAANKAWNAYYVANNLINQNDAEQLIADCQGNIVRYQQTQLNYKNNVTNQETLIAQYKAELNTIDGEIAAQQAIIDNLKKMIDAAIAAQK